MLQSIFSVTFDRPGGACSGRPFVDVAQITSSKAGKTRSEMVEYLVFVRPLMG